MHLIIGSHVSFNKDKQLLGCVLDTINYGANTFMFYTGAPQNTNRFVIDDQLTKEAHLLMKENKIDINNVIVHAPYIINLGNAKSLDTYDFSIKFLHQELIRCQQLGVKKIVLHPGAHVNMGSDLGLKNVIQALNKAMIETNDVTICLETMSGKGTELGCDFDELKTIIDGVVDQEHIGVCLDTCHLNDYGYDLQHFDEILDDFDQIIGLDKLKCIHINDSKNQMGIRKDRHDNIGLGYIGFDNLINIIYNERLKDIPKILETPYVSYNETKRLYPPYKFEIDMIKNKRFNDHLLDDIRTYYE